MSWPNQNIDYENNNDFDDDNNGISSSPFNYGGDGRRELQRGPQQEQLITEDHERLTLGQRDHHNNKKRLAPLWVYFFLELMASLYFYTIVGIPSAFGVSPLLIGLSHGFARLVVMSAFSDNFAGYVDPFIVFISFMLGILPHTKNTTWFKKIRTILIYILAQTIGVILANLIIWAVVQTFTSGLGAPSLAVGVNFTAGFVYELFGSFVLYSLYTFVIFMFILLQPKSIDYTTYETTSSEQSNRSFWFNKITFENLVIALIIGLAFTVLNGTGVFISGGAFNWYRHFWPSLFSGNLDITGLIYFFAPFTSLIITCVFIYITKYRGSGRKKK